MKPVFVPTHQAPFPKRLGDPMLDDRGVVVILQEQETSSAFSFKSGFFRSPKPGAPESMAPRILVSYDCSPPSTDGSYRYSIDVSKATNI